MLSIVSYFVLKQFMKQRLKRVKSKDILGPIQKSQGILNYLLKRTKPGKTFEIISILDLEHIKQIRIRKE